MKIKQLTTLKHKLQWLLLLAALLGVSQGALEARTIYLTNEGTGKAFCYVWNCSESKGNWPGASFTGSDTSCTSLGDGGFYSMAIKDEDACNIIINNNNGGQTGDIQITGDVWGIYNGSNTFSQKMTASNMSTSERCKFASGGLNGRSTKLTATWDGTEGKFVLSNASWTTGDGIDVYLDDTKFLYVSGPSSQPTGTYNIKWNPYDGTFTFAASCTPPTVTANDAINIRPTSATISGSYTGGSEIGTPTFTVSGGTLGAVSCSNGTCTASLTGLTAGTTYNYTFDVPNACGTTTSSQKSFTTCYKYFDGDTYLYIDVSAVDWFTNADAVPNMNFDGGTWNDASLVTGKIYKIKPAAGCYSTFGIRRHGSEYWNECASNSLSAIGNNNELVLSDNWNSGGSCSNYTWGTYTPPAPCTPPSSGFAVNAQLNYGDGSPWVGTSGSGTGGSKASGGQFSNGHREVRLSTNVNADYYQWYTCNSSGSSLSAISGATAKTYTYDVSLPGTYYYICKAGCSNPADVASSVVQIDIPWPDMGISGPFYDGSWNHTSAGGSGPKFTNNNDGTWTNTFTPNSSNLTSEFIIIQQYKLDCAANSGWDGYQECSGSDDGNKICYSGSTISSHPGLNQTGACNFSSNISLNSGDVVTINVTMTDYNTYTVSLEKAPCATVCDKSEESFTTLMVGASEDKTFTFEYGEGINIGSVSITGASANQFAVKSVSTSANVATVVVTHHPTSAGTHNASISIPYTGTSSGTHSKSISAEAKTYYIKGTIAGDNWGDNRPMTSTDGETYTYTFTSLSPAGDYKFKVYDNSKSGDAAWAGASSATVNRSTPSVTVAFNSGNDVTFNADIAGNYTFTFNATSKLLTVTYPCPASYTTNYNVTGGGIYCSANLPVGLSGSQNGYLYKLYKGSDAVDTQTGGGSALSFTSQYAAGTYTVKVTAAAGCPEEPVDDGATSSVTITAGSHPDKDYFSVSGNEPTYNGTAQSATVVSYDTDAYNPASITVKYGSASGTSSKTDAGEYGIYVTAASAVGNFCAVTSAIELDDKLTISKVTPSASNKDEIFDISGVPATVTYNGESHGATVNWKDGYSNVGTRTIYYKKGSEDATTTAPVKAGTYAVTVDVAAGDNNDASASPISLGNIVINKANQSTVTVTNAGNYCSGSSITATAEGGTGTGAISFTKVSGPDGITINSSTGAITASTTGSIVVTVYREGDSNYEDSDPVDATFYFVAGPNVINLSNTGTSTICSGEDVELQIGDASGGYTQTGYKYQLYQNGTPYGDPVDGENGKSKTFPVSESGIYTAKAYPAGDTEGNCLINMSGEIFISISTTPTLVRSMISGVRNYMPVTVTSINTDIVSWKLQGIYNNATTPDDFDFGGYAYFIDQTESSITFKGKSTYSTYTVTAYTRGGCEASTTISVADDTNLCP